MKKFLLVTIFVFFSFLIQISNSDNIKGQSIDLCSNIPNAVPSEYTIGETEGNIVVTVEIAASPSIPVDDIAFGYGFEYDEGYKTNSQDSELIGQTTDGKNILQGTISQQEITLGEFMQFGFYIKSNPDKQLLKISGSETDCWTEMEIKTLVIDNCLEGIGGYENYYQCIWETNSPQGWKVFDSNCDTGFTPNPQCNQSNTDSDSFSSLNFCAPCINQSAVPTQSQHGESCDENNQCGQLRCREYQAQKVCLYDPLTVDEDTANCIVGFDECKQTNSFSDELTCAKTNTEMGNPGETGKCWPKKNFPLLAEPCIPGLAGDGHCTQVMRDNNLGQNARCVGTGSNGVCEYTNGQFPSTNPDPNEQTPVDPTVLISNNAITACEGDLTCINCHIRECLNPPDCTQTREFENISELFTDADADDPTTAKNELIVDIKYTNYVYSAVGCIDTSESGTATRFLQIALGIIGGVIIVRVGQIVMLLQAGDPEKFKEAWDYIWSIILALLTLLFAVIGTQFLGINITRVLPPGTIVTDN